MAEQQPAALQRRIALYSHDAMGLGHLRRNLAIATALVQQPEPTEVLLICGSREVSTFTIPRGIDCVTLPALSKSTEGRYQPRSLGRSLDEVIALRAGIILAAVEAFQPDLLVVDKLARGVCNELDATLAHLATTSTRCVLGLRDVLDGPQRTRREWIDDATTETIEAHYDRVWVYGDPVVFDPVQAYGLPGSVAARTDYTGYLGHGRPIGAPPSGPEVAGGVDALCLLGGGQDGVALARAFVEALPDDRSAIVVTGPYMSRNRRAQLARAAADHAACQVVELVDGCEQLIASARSTVSMGGYNSVCELMASGRRPLIVPRVRPREEQLVRAARLAELDLVDLLHPDLLDPERLRSWITGARPSTPPSSTAVDLDGLGRIPSLAADLLAHTTKEISHAVG